jgi:hypothetical protein
VPTDWSGANKRKGHRRDGSIRRRGSEEREAPAFGSAPHLCRRARAGLSRRPLRHGSRREQVCIPLPHFSDLIPGRSLRLSFWRLAADWPCGRFPRLRFRRFGNATRRAAQFLRVRISPTLSGRAERIYDRSNFEIILVPLSFNWVSKTARSATLRFSRQRCFNRLDHLRRVGFDVGINPA